MVKVLFKRKFLNDLKKLNDPIKSKIEKLVFETIPNSKNIKEIRNLKKIAGSSYYYRLRIGDYRIGLKIEGNVVIFYRVLHRKKIYKYFP